MDEPLRDKAFVRLILAVVIDEAHVVSHWDAGFRKKYGELGMIRAFLRRETPIVAMSATLSPRVRNDVLRVGKLEFAKEGYALVNVGNDRSNVAPLARAIEHAQETYVDLNFVIPNGTRKAEDVPLTLIYADNFPKSIDVIDHLETILPAQLRHRGLIRPFCAAFPHDYHSSLLDSFKKKEVRVMICTDAAGMVSRLYIVKQETGVPWQGCNLPAVEMIIQWKLPSSLSAFVQRAGRAARAPDRTGIAVLLVENPAYGTDIDAGAKTKATRKVTRTRKETAALAIANGVQRGSYGGKRDAIVGERSDREADPFSTDEGLLAFVQTTLGRRQIITKVHQNAVSKPFSSNPNTSLKRLRWHFKVLRETWCATFINLLGRS
jgi:superfamily II DNA helicase RecQ